MEYACSVPPVSMAVLHMSPLCRFTQNTHQQIQRKCHVTGVTSSWIHCLHRRLGVMCLMHWDIFPDTICYFVMHESGKYGNLTFTNTENTEKRCLQTPNRGWNICVLLLCINTSVTLVSMLGPAIWHLGFFVEGLKKVIGSY